MNVPYRYIFLSDVYLWCVFFFIYLADEWKREQHISDVNHEMDCRNCVSTPRYSLFTRGICISSQLFLFCQRRRKKRQDPLTNFSYVRYAFLPSSF